MITININDTVKNIVEEHPAFKKVMNEIGLKKVMNKNMLNTVGRFTPLKHGIKIKRIPLETLQEVANKYGFLVVEPKND